jgi:hypothetical protein
VKFRNGAPRGVAVGAGVEVAAANPTAMATASDVEQLERSLLRRGVRRLAEGRDRCADCARTPLVGERVHLYERLPGIVCELCRQLRRDSPVATEIVHHSELGHAVRLTARAA